MVKPQDFKGTNYLPCTTLGIFGAFGMLDNPGTYWRPWVEQELRFIRSVGFNSLRLHGASFLGWAIHRQQFMANLEHLAGVCAANGLAITWQFWSTTPGNLGTHTTCSALWMFPSSLVAGIRLLLHSYASLPYPPGELGNYTLIPEPGLDVVRDWPDPEKTWESAKGKLREKMLEFVGEIARFFGQHPVGRAAFGSYDLFNEPDISIPDYGTLPIPLILDTYKEVVRHHSGAEITVGFAHPERATDVWKAYRAALQGIQTYWSFHTDVGRIGRHKDVMSSLPDPKVASEFWHTHPSHDQSGRMAELLAGITSQGWGGQMWGFLRTNAFLASGSRLVPIDGIVRPKRPHDLRMLLEFEVQHPNDYWPLAAWLVQRDSLA